ncbi:DUF7507 domain-containing protein [Adlercreutzia faecimuris]|uniref:DUF7507 domain-containing protein n=1 Tax=Adlercreutzia faecimuris TaxID=2897341 RepID=A0ABS9WHL0_9ACTN|nr:hypothetical protein [Adlercreutzia sp. JBNU-10]MCI2242358.1 hypothetical protein [Adlercreutzia sp. JBNU-10]
MKTGEKRGGRPTRRPHDARYAQRRRIGALLGACAMALALAVMTAPDAPSFAGAAEGGAPAASAPAAGARASATASASETPAPGPAAAPAAAEDAADRPPALAVPEAVPTPAAPTPAPQARPAATGDAATPASGAEEPDPAAPEAPDGAAPEPEPAPESFVTILYRTSPGTAGNVRPGEELVRASDGAGLGGSVATPLKGYVCIGWYNGANQVSADAVLTRDEALAGADRNADGTLAATTFIARFARPSASLRLTEELVSAPANGRCFTEGEAVTFRATVTNTGNVDLATVTFAGDIASFAPVGPLAPGQTRSSEWTHVVTADDVQRDALMSTVTAHGEAPAYGLAADAGPESATAQTGELPAGDTYVLYGAYPAEGGQVSRSILIVESRTGAGLEAVTAEPAAGYVFEGWYEDDERVSTEAELGAETALGFLNHGRSSFSPTLFLAHFVKEEPKPDVPDTPGGGEPVDPDDPDDPSQPDNPDEPGNPDEPANPDDPGQPDVPGGAPDEPATPGAPDAGAPDAGGASGNTAPAAPGAPDNAKAAGTRAPDIPQTGDNAPALAALLLITAAASAVLLRKARTHLA